jgi:hypothetical protein
MLNVTGISLILTKFYTIITIISILQMRKPRHRSLAKVTHSANLEFKCRQSDPKVHVLSH